MDGGRLVLLAKEVKQNYQNPLRRSARLAGRDELTE
jgi:hypothetical protein